MIICGMVNGMVLATLTSTSYSITAGMTRSAGLPQQKYVQLAHLGQCSSCGSLYCVYIYIIIYILIYIYIYYNVYMYTLYI